MPRSGYDCSGAAPGSPASEAAARGRDRRVAGNRTPRGRSPAIRPLPNDDDNQTTPRASHTSLPTGAPPNNSVIDPQADCLAQAPQAQWTATRPAQMQMQNPLTAALAQPNQAMGAAQFNALFGQRTVSAGPTPAFPFDATSMFSVPTQFPVSATAMGNDTFIQHQGSRLGNWTGNQHRAQPQVSMYPDPEQYSQVGRSVAGTAQISASNANMAAPKGGNSDGDVEMADAEDN